jgi:hypothetical protein
MVVTAFYLAQTYVQTALQSYEQKLCADCNLCGGKKQLARAQDLLQLLKFRHEKALGCVSQVQKRCTIRRRTKPLLHLVESGGWRGGGADCDGRARWLVGTETVCSGTDNSKCYDRSY